jgi:hypothetical protein
MPYRIERLQILLKILTKIGAARANLSEKREIRGGILRELSEFVTLIYNFQPSPTNGVQQAVDCSLIFFAETVI